MIEGSSRCGKPETGSCQKLCRGKLALADDDQGHGRTLRPSAAAFSPAEDLAGVVEQSSDCVARLAGCQAEESSAGLRPAVSR